MARGPELLPMCRVNRMYSIEAEITQEPTEMVTRFAFQSASYCSSSNQMSYLCYATLKCKMNTIDGLRLGTPC